VVSDDAACPTSGVDARSDSASAEHRAFGPPRRAGGQSRALGQALPAAPLRQKAEGRGMTVLTAKRVGPGPDACSSAISGACASRAVVRRAFPCGRRQSVRWPIAYRTRLTDGRHPRRNAHRTAGRTLALPCPWRCGRACRRDGRDLVRSHHGLYELLAASRYFAARRIVRRALSRQAPAYLRST
jgi:hypothetical protein